jgi:hypothetical protein
MREKELIMDAVAETKTPHGRMLTGDDLLRVGQSLKVLAVTVILLLSTAVIVLAVEQWVETSNLAQMFRVSGQVVYGFAFLMLITVGYLIGKGRSTTRYQRTLIAQLLEEESITRARRLDPILEFHHPEICREILMRQANYGARIGSPVSLVEVTIPGISKLAIDEETRPVVEEFFLEMRRLCRPLDFWVRWTPHSFLLVLLEVSPQEAAGVVYRLRSQFNQWWEQQDEVPSRLRSEWRYRTVGSLGSSGDIVREVRNLMEHDQFVATPMPDVWQSKDGPMEAVTAESPNVARRSR